MVLQELEIRYGHGKSFSGQLEILLVYLSEIQFGVVENPETNVMD